jgi:hypothetical protein
MNPCKNSEVKDAFSSGGGGGGGEQESARTQGAVETPGRSTSSRATYNSRDASISTVKEGQ